MPKIPFDVLIVFAWEDVILKLILKKRPCMTMHQMGVFWTMSPEVRWINVKLYILAAATQHHAAEFIALISHDSDRLYTLDVEGWFNYIYLSNTQLYTFTYEHTFSHPMNSNQ